MPLELIADTPGHAILSPYEERLLAPNEVRIKSLFSSVKHGTELRGFRADTPRRLRPLGRRAAPAPPRRIDR